MIITAYDGYTFSTGSYTVNLPDPSNIGNFSMNPQLIERRGVSPSYTGATVTSRSIPATVLYEGTALTPEAALQKLLGILDPTNDQPRTLTAQMNDGTTVGCDAIVMMPAFKSADELVNGIEVIFFTNDPYWRSLTATTVTATVTGDTAVALVNEGQARAYPTFKITPMTQRVSSTSSVGWTYRKQVTITNNTTRDWVDEPVCVDLGDTASLVTGSKALASGNDLRIRYQGQEYNRTLTCWNTGRSLAHFAFSLKAGASATIDVVYGNSNASAPRDMSTRTGSGATYIAYDLEGASGTATAASTTTNVVISGSPGYEVNRWKGGFLGILSGTGSIRWRRIASNDSNSFTLNRALNTAPDGTSKIVVWKSGIFMDGGRVVAKTASTMQDDQHTTKWGTNQLAGATVTFVGGSGATPSTMTVLSNTSDTLTFTGSFSVQPAVGDSYTIQRYGVWNYMVDTTIQLTAHRGLYRANKYFSQPTTIQYGDQVPAAFQPTTRLQNRDDFSAMKPYDTGSGGGHNSNFWPVLRIRRRMGQDARYKDEGNGDGLSMYTAFGLQGVYFDYQYKNVNEVGKFTLSVLDPGGTDWLDAVTKSTKQTSKTTVAAQYVDLSGYDEGDGNPTRLGMFVLPYDEQLMGQRVTSDGTVTGITSTVTTDSSQAWTTDVWKNGTITYDSDSTASPKSQAVVSNTATTITTAAWGTNPTVGDNFTVERDVDERDEIEARTNSAFVLTLDLDAFGSLASSVYAVGSEQAIYDLNAILRFGGGSESQKTPPYERIRTGGNGHSLHLVIGSEALWIRCDPLTTEPIAGVYNASGILQYRCPWAVRVYHHELDLAGTDTAMVSRDFVPIPAKANLLANPSFDTDVTTGWAAYTTTGGVTVAWSRDTATTYQGAGALKGVISAAPAGAWQALYRSTTSVVIPDLNYDAAIWVRTTNVNLHAYIAIEWATTAGGGGGQLFQNEVTLPSTGTWYPIGLGEIYPNDGGDITARIIVGIKGTGAVTGTVYFDSGTLGVPNLYVSETAVGAFSVGTNWYAGWWG